LWEEEDGRALLGGRAGRRGIVAPRGRVPRWGGGGGTRGRGFFPFFAREIVVDTSPF